MYIGTTSAPQTRLFFPINILPFDKHRLVIASGILLMLLGGASTAWAGERLKSHAAPIHMMGFSIHIGPSVGIHLGVGGHRHGYRKSQRGYRKHFGYRDHFNRSRHFYRHFDRHRHSPRYYRKHKKHRHAFKERRQHRRHRH